MATETGVIVRLSIRDQETVSRALKSLGDDGERALKRIERAASGGPTPALQALSSASEEARGAIEGLSARAGTFGSVMASIGPTGLAAAAAVGAIVIAMRSALGEVEIADKSYRRLEAVLKATGYAAGLTADDIASFADGVERSTMTTAEAVEDAASILATFRSISGDTFTRTIALAQDMSTVFGQDLSSSVTQLGKALESPVDGLTALRRVGVSFTEAQRDMIKAMVDAGRTADAQRVILDALEQQVGGAGAADAAGLSGATKRLQDAWGNLLETFGRTTGVTSVALGALDMLQRAITRITSAFADDPVGPSITKKTAELTKAREELARLQAGGPGTAMLGQRSDIEEQQRRVASLEQELAALDKISDAEARASSDERARVDAGKMAAEAERRADALTSLRSGLSKELGDLATPAERIAKINSELAETKKRLESLRATDGSNAADIDAAARQAEEIAKRQMAAITSAGGGSASKTKLATIRGYVGPEPGSFRAAQEVGLDEGVQLSEKLQKANQTMQGIRDDWLQSSGDVIKLIEVRRDRELAALDQIGLSEQQLAEARSLIAAKAANDISKEYERTADKVDETGTQVAESLKGMFGVLENTLSGVFADLILGSEVTAQSIMRAFARAIVQSGIQSLISGANTAAGDGGLWGALIQGAVSIFGSLAGGYGATNTGVSAGATSYDSGGYNMYSSNTFMVARGAAFDAGNVIPFSRGGLVDRPTLFPMARGGTGLMGEDGIEAVMPLRRLPSGRLGVESVGGGGSGLGSIASTVNVTVNTQSDDASTVGAETARSVRKAVRESIMQVIQQERRPGGRLAPGIEGLR